MNDIEIKLKKQINYVMNNSLFYKKKYKKFLTSNSDIVSNFYLLPFTTKKELLDDQIEFPPFGSNLCVDKSKIGRIHKTSGTTNKPLLITLTENDIKKTVEIGGKCFSLSGLLKEDIVVHCLSYNMWMGGYTDHQSLEATGAAVIPFGVGNTENLIETILTIKPTAIHCTPSYLAKIELVLNEKFNLTPKDLNIKLGLFGAESGLQNRKFREQIENKWGMKAMNANYGMADVLSIFGSECYKKRGLHFMGKDVLMPELINPDNLTPLPLQSNQVGELVLTNLEKEAQPLIRYRTNDVIKILSTKKCVCGCNDFVFEIIGRSDDMFVVKGVNVFVNAISSVVYDFFSELSGDFQIHVNSQPPIDKVLLILEIKQKNFTEKKMNSLKEAIFNKCKVNLNISPDIKFVDFGMLPKTEGKSKRIFKTL